MAAETDLPNQLVEGGKFPWEPHSTRHLVIPAPGDPRSFTDQLEGCKREIPVEIPPSFKCHDCEG